MLHASELHALQRHIMVTNMLGMGSNSIVDTSQQSPRMHGVVIRVGLPVRAPRGPLLLLPLGVDNGTLPPPESPCRAATHTQTVKGIRG